MSPFETVGFFWVILCTGVMTFAALTAIVSLAVIGGRTARRRYEAGREQELRDLREQQSFRDELKPAT